MDSTLDINNLDEVLELLRRHHYVGINSYQLGLSLGLLPRTLDRIESDHKGDSNRCLLECMKEWLKQADNVKGKGGPTYYVLINGLRSIEENTVANGIHSDKHPACMILARHQYSQSILDVLLNLAILLSKEELVGEMLVPSTSQDLLTAVQEAVCNDYRNLEKFGAVLQKTPSTASLGDAILKEYREKINGEKTIQEGGAKIRIPRSLNPEFVSMRGKFAGIFFDVNEAMTTPPPPVNVTDVKRYLRAFYSHLRPKLSQCDSIDDILDLVSDQCSLTNISLLEALVNKFNIEQVKIVIQQYKDSVKEFCQAMPLRLCLNEHLSSPSSLKCEIATFLVDRSVDESTFKDIDDIVTIAFENKVKVVVVRESNSFIITCSFPLALSSSLIASARKNIDLLKERGVYQLTIGYCTVFSHKPSSQEQDMLLEVEILKEQLLLFKTDKVTQEEEKDRLIDKDEISALKHAHLTAEKGSGISVYDKSKMIITESTEQDDIQAQDIVEALQEKVSFLSAQLLEKELLQESVASYKQKLEDETIVKRKMILEIDRLRSKTEPVESLEKDCVDESLIGGYKCDFVKTPPSYLTCGICQLPARGPREALCCGAAFCKSCISNVQSNICPLCKEMGFKAVIDRQAVEIVLNLEVYCKFKDRGCEWVGELYRLDKHCQSCDYNHDDSRSKDQSVSDRDKDELILSLTDVIATKDKEISKLLDTVASTKKKEEYLSVYVEESKEIIRHREHKIADILDENERLRAGTSMRIASTDEAVQLEHELKHFHDKLSAKNKFILELTSKLHSKDEEIKEQDEEIKRKSEEIKRQDEEIQRLHSDNTGLKQQMFYVFNHTDNLSPEPSIQAQQVSDDRLCPICNQSYATSSQYEFERHVNNHLTVGDEIENL